MEKYLEQLIADIESATKSLLQPARGFDFADWIPDLEEDKTAPRRNLQELTGITAQMLPPESKLNDEQVSFLLSALKKLLDECNWCFVMQIEVPERIQYTTIRENFDQEIIIKTWHTGFFEFCRPGTEHKKCSLGEYCHCAFYATLIPDFPERDSDPEEERERALEIELKFIKSKHGKDWWKYYPYHLDKHWDDEYGRPFDYGCGEDDSGEFELY